jgi:hypothetical protein
VGVRTGARFYNFAANARSQLVLFTRCHLTGARHGFVSNGVSTTSGIVFHRSTTAGGADMEGHRYWTQAMLFDNIAESGSGSVKLINRGDWGTSHGWGSAHSMSWRFNKASYIQKPPTARNYGVTDIGTFSTNYAWPGPTGFTEQKSGTLIPESLYEAQLCERLQGMSSIRGRVFRTPKRERVLRTALGGTRLKLPSGLDASAKSVDLRDLSGRSIPFRELPGGYLEIPGGSGGIFFIRTMTEDAVKP